MTGNQGFIYQNCKILAHIPLILNITGVLLME